MRAAEKSGAAERHHANAVHDRFEEGPIDSKPFVLQKGAARPLEASTNQIDSLVLDGRTRLLCAKGITLYANSVSAAPNALVSLDADPLSLQLIESGHQVDVSCPFTGVIQAPAAMVEVQTPGDFYGAIVGAEVKTVAGVNLHFDRSLPKRTRGPVQRWIATSVVE